MLSKLLKRAINASPQILVSSKQVCETLSSLQIPHGKTAYLLTADVVSCYTNIPLEPLPDVCSRNVFKHLLPGHSIGQVELAGKLCKIANDFLAFEYVNEQGEREFYHQKKGLAMGVACSPDIANLYIGEYEQHIKNHPEILYYGRFIDDIFSIIIAPSETEAMNIAKTIIEPAPGLEYKWESNSKRIVFLDIEISISNQSFEYKPYRKPLNHFERIPWSSAHPLWMKRGTFVGELGRIANLSSSIDTFLAAVEDLKRIYIARDYPLKLVKSWIKNHALQRWEKTGKKKEDGLASSPLILKSELNTAWDSVSMEKVFKNMWDCWTMEGDLALPDNLRNTTHMILSRRRTKNLGDMLQLFNASLTKHRWSPESRQNVREKTEEYDDVGTPRTNRERSETPWDFWAGTVFEQ
jgi:hypothetical protein